jgi:3-deoxy-manno-octulosonate cytidylyltransferase (CMP-KDO synthetase)
VKFASRNPLPPAAEPVRNERILGVIPARLGSERLPRKPLHLLAGRPLLEWVWRRVSSFSTLHHVVVATDASEIADVCSALGADVVLTAAEHGSGTERVAEVIERPQYAGYGLVVNVQGDEPFVSEEQVAGAVAQVRLGFHIGTVAAPVATREAWRDPAVVKVVRRADGGALYFSRSPIPWRRDGEPGSELLGGEHYLRHIGVSAYTPAVLQQWVTLGAAPLEALEQLEQLRALAAGLNIGVGLVGVVEGGVDTAADAERAAALLDLEQHT